MNQYRECSDKELFQLMQGGDHRAFEVIYHRYKGILYLHAYRKLASEEKADEEGHDRDAYRKEMKIFLGPKCGERWAAPADNANILQSIANFLYNRRHVVRYF